MYSSRLSVYITLLSGAEIEVQWKIMTLPRDRSQEYVSDLGNEERVDVIMCVSNPAS